MIHLIWQLPLMWFAYSQITEIQHWPIAWQSLLMMAPYVISALGVFIAVWLNRAQPVMILLTLMALNAMLFYFLGQERHDISAQVAYPLLTILLPLSFFVWLIIPERGIQNKPYLFSAASIFAMLGVTFFWALEGLPIDLIKHLSMPVQNISMAIKIPMIGMVISLVILLLMLTRNAMCQRLKVLDNTLILVLILLMIGLNDFQTYGVMAWVSSLSALMILLAIIFDAHHMAYVDELTGLKGRRALFETFMGLGRKYSIAMMDIDHFKKFNDTYGHDIGDVVLRAVADNLAMIETGSVYRYGGEEFTVVLKGKTPEEAKPYLEQVRQAIEHMKLKVPVKNKMTEVKVTVSFGVAARDDTHKKPTQVMKAADEALYQAKQAGRNCTFISGEKTTKTPAKRIKQ
ncbi:GGDEF domain-containing protein [Thiosulfativibrio zosterae]|uniref:diguanylate cyclase n=1 Tax=Thiosulfativibrio zosterae TaxID=2675053 RepID=A0A6F8PN14_9GAMM|nr:GGDEF domain-containing protein [Thiosulfativibrio zosterae]BBP43485.1 GGDEF domain-containing protein [Thiosulfativibrio zosterae]